MQYRRLGNSGLKVSPLCLGSMQFGWTADEPASFRVMDTFVEAGGNFIDTADAYSLWFPGNQGGESETIIGRWMRERNHRHLMVVATKFNGRLWEGPNGDGLSRGHVMKAVDDSLRRLQTDYIDLYQTHWPHYDTPQEETLRALDDLVRAGKVRYLGCSNEPAWRLMKAMCISEKHNLNRFISSQPPYSLVRRAGFERELEAACLGQGVKITGRLYAAAAFNLPELVIRRPQLSHRKPQPAVSSCGSNFNHGWKAKPHLRDYLYPHLCLGVPKRVKKPDGLLNEPFFWTNKERIP